MDYKELESPFNFDCVLMGIFWLFEAFHKKKLQEGCQSPMALQILHKYLDLKAVN